MSDETCLTQLQAGDAEAFRALFVRYHPVLCRFAAGLLRDQAAAEEAVQELFLTLWEKRATLRIQGSVRYYLFTAARNRALNRVRAARRTLPLPPSAYEAPTADLDPSQLVGLDDLHAHLELAIRQLPSQAREAYRLRHTEQLAQREIAQQMNLSESTVEKHLARASRLLRRQLLALGYR